MTSFKWPSLSYIGAFAALLLMATGAAANEKRHAMSLVGEPKYEKGFKHFDYVNPNAPKGGNASLSRIGTFDSLNLIPYKGNQAAGLGLVYDALMTTSMDEPSTEYGELAEWVSHPDDYSSATFKLREEARWHDGKPVTPEDVIFSLKVQQKHNPQWGFYYQNVTDAKKTGEREVTFYFDEKNNRELPHIMGQLLVLPKHFYEGNADRDPGSTWLEAPLGSGPYRVKTFEPGRFIVYERVEDYWGKDLNVNVGQNNFDEIRFEYFKDRVPAFEAFKTGKIDFFDENSAKNWATAYDFPAINEGRVIKRDDITLDNPIPMQAFIPNIRREKFADPRVRYAFNLMFNFQWMNKNIFYDQYDRTSSFFENTELEAKGLPEGQELAILEELRDQVPPEVFTKHFENPVNDPRSLVDRRNRREAMTLLRAAGWTIENGVLVHGETREPMTVEFMLVSPTFERVVGPYRQALEKIGVQVSIRVVDAAQYKRRLDNFDYDIIIGGWRQSESPGNEQRDYWGSQAADRPGSRNWVGIKNPAVDTLINRIIFAKDREELVAASRALDRVLLWNHYVVPQYHVAHERIAYWDKFSHPETLPSRAVGFLTVWWYDQEKAAQLASN